MVKWLAIATALLLPCSRSHLNVSRVENNIKIRNGGRLDAFFF